MKKLFTFSLLALIIINCQESRDSQLSKNQFLKNVGQPIPLTDAERWVSRFRSEKNNGKSDALEIDIAALAESLQPTSGKVGVSLNHAIDDNGAHHILLIPFEEDQSWGSFIVDANAGITDGATAKRWTDRYKNENPDGTWSHFFGIHVFNEIFESTPQQLQIIEGIDDEGRPQLLLYVWRNSSTTEGRIANDDVTVYDKSITCPPDCSNSSNVN